MKGITVAVLFGALFCTAVLCHAVPPAYEGQFGNPEEPALRVVKWPWLGLRKMVMYTHDGLKSGIHCHPPAALCEGGCGAARGTFVLIDHTGRGMIYQKLPPKGSLRVKASYEEQALAFIHEVTYARKEAADMAITAPAEASPDGVDEYGNPYLPFRVKERPIFAAQRRYVPERTVQRDRSLARRENLLRLAR